MQSKCLSSNVELAQNSEDMNISCMQGTHSSYLSQHSVRSDALQAEPNKIFPVKSLGLFIFLFHSAMQSKFQNNTKIFIVKSSHTCVNMF